MFAAKKAGGKVLAFGKRQFHSSPSNPNGKPIPTGTALTFSSMSPLRKALGVTLAGAGLGAFAFMQWQPHQVLSPLQFYFKNKQQVIFPIKEKPHY